MGKKKKWTATQRAEQSRKLKAYYASPEARQMAADRAKRGAAKRKRNRRDKTLPAIVAAEPMQHVRMPAPFQVQELLSARSAADETQELAELIVAVHNARKRERV